MSPPRHHAPNGRFRDPWDDGVQVVRGLTDFLRWSAQRLRSRLPADPDPEEIPTGSPAVADPRARSTEVRVTWIGHASFLIQAGGLNLLTDPVFSDRVSPVPWAGPRRFLPPGLTVDELPPLDAVLLSHDHFDHLDRASVVAIRNRFGARVPWITPLGYRRWFARVGVGNVRELDWWEPTTLVGSTGPVRLVATPARHWTRRRWAVNTRLWCSYAIEVAEGPKVYWGGDSGWFPAYGEIARRLGPFDLVMLPIGAYEPRWFMRGAHMNPEDAVRAYGELGSSGAFLPMHWGTFRLTDEDPLEPPDRLREAWVAAGHPDERLHVPGIGGTVVVARPS